MAATLNLYFDENTLDDYHKKENHRGNCVFDTFPVQITKHRRNLFVPQTIWVHIRVCVCNYSHLYPDRSAEYIMDNQLINKDIVEK